MKFERDDMKVGLVVIAALVIFGSLLFHRTFSELFRKETQVRVLLEDVTDLVVGTEVQLQGLRVGQVKGIALERDGVRYRFVATLGLRPDIVLWKGTKGVVVSKLVGGAYMDLQLPAPDLRAEALQPGALLEGGRAASVAALLEQMKDFIGNLNGALTELRGQVKARGIGAVLDHPDVRRTLQNLDATLLEARRLALDGQAAVKRNDPLLHRNLESLEKSLAILEGVLAKRQGQVDEILVNMAAVLQELNGLSAEARALLRAQGPEVDTTLKALNRNLQSTEELLQLLKAKPNRLVWGTPSDAEKAAARQQAEEARKAQAPPK